MTIAGILFSSIGAKEGTGLPSTIAGNAAIATELFKHQMVISTTHNWAKIAVMVILFPQQIALTAIAILAIGDSVTNIVGRYFGEIENPLNPKKTIEGSLVGFFFSLAVASFFVSFWPAFFASAGAIFVESLRLKIGNLEIDDNIIIPLTAGWILTLWYF